MVQYIIDVRDGRMQIVPQQDVVVAGKELWQMRFFIRERKGFLCREKRREVIMIRVLVPIFVIDE